MKKIYIIGNGGFAKEVLFLSQRVLNQDEVIFSGFIDYKPESNSVAIGGKQFPVIDEDWFLENNSHSDDIEIFFGIGDPTVLKRVYKRFEGFHFPNLIHPNVELHYSSFILGQGNIITSGCILTVDVQIGSFNVFNLNSTVGHDTKIGDFNIFNPGANISGSVIIKDCNLIGTNATILQEISIGSNNIFGASSMVNKNVGDNMLMVGVPAKQLIKK